MKAFVVHSAFVFKMNANVMNETLNIHVAELFLIDCDVMKTSFNAKTLLFVFFSDED